VVAYDDTARSFLLRAKLGRRPELLSSMGRQLARALEVVGFTGGCTALTVVPSHPVATLRRGFSPALELARPVAGLLDLPLRGGLIRRKLHASRPVKRMSARSRRPAVRHAFVVRNRLPGCRVLLIDDVMTTGESVAACARALKGAGALEVRVAVWARTLPHFWRGGAFRDV
jgi:predicted amidophosphoribosyltransferase